MQKLFRTTLNVYSKIEVPPFGYQYCCLRLQPPPPSHTHAQFPTFLIEPISKKHLQPSSNWCTFYVLFKLTESPRGGGLLQGKKDRDEHWKS